MANRKNEPMVTIKLPRISNRPSREFVSVGERQWIIERGKNVKIPLCAYDVLRNAELAEDAAVSYMETVPGNIANETNT